jgi:hypothetical protein
MRRLVTAVLVLVIASVVAPGLALAAPPAGCPKAMPTSEIRAEAGDADGFPATGWTVSRGTAPEEFQVQVLGVLDGGVAPGVDMIIVKVDSPAIDAAKGIWAGMSGSPVHTDGGRLVGAVAYGLSFGPSEIGGLAAAEDMLRLLDLPLADQQLQASVRLPSGLQSKAGAPPGARMDRLRLPLGVSGLQANRLDAFASRLGLGNAIAHIADAADPVPGDPSEIVAGGNFAAALSYGYLSSAGIGTTTFVCRDRAVAFGHPMLFDGPSGLSVHSANAIVVQDDPTLVPFKLANLGGFVGTLDQDRLSGIRALLGDAPEPVEVRSVVDGTAQLETWVNRTVHVPDVAAFHLLSDIDGTTDRIGAGTAQVGWTVIGTAGSEDFSMTRTNRYANPFDISFASIFELLDQLLAVTENRFSDVTFDTVRLTATTGSAFRQYRIEGLERREAGEWVPVDADAPLEVMPGSNLRIRVLLSAYRDAAPAPVELRFSIPDDAAGSEVFLSVTGGGNEEGEEGGGEEPSSFDELIAQLEDALRNDEILAELGFGGEEEGGGAPLASVRRRVAEVVTGSVGVPVFVAGGEPGPEPEPELPPDGGPPLEPGFPLDPGGEPQAFDLLGASKQRLGRALRRGIRLTVRSGEPGVLSLRAGVDRRTARLLDLDKRVVGKLVRRLDAGESRVRLTLSRSARRHLRHANRVALTLRAAFRGASGTQRTSTKVVLRRMRR